MTSIDDLFEEVQRQVDSAPIPACQVAVGHGGAIVAFRSFGQATNSSRFSIFSTTFVPKKPSLPTLVLPTKKISSSSWNSRAREVSR